MPAKRKTKKKAVAKKDAPKVFYVRVRPYNPEAIPAQKARNYSFEGVRYRDVLGWYGPIDEVQAERMGKEKLHPTYASVFECVGEKDLPAHVIAERQEQGDLSLSPAAIRSPTGEISTLDLAGVS